jgi:ADP-ribosylglycohydrolase
MALLKGDGDFGRTLGIAVMAGMDTDCNGATAGSIMGCALGTGGIPADWTEPFHDTIRTQLKDLPQLKISELATRLYQVARTHTRRG